MNWALLVVSGVAAWCGTPPRPWPWPWPWPPPPDPDPFPWVSKIIAVVGGLVGGWAISALTGASGLTAAVFGGVMGGIVFSDVYGFIRGGLKQG